MIYCSKCGEAFEDGTEICAACGAPLQEPSAPVEVATPVEVAAPVEPAAPAAPVIPEEYQPLSPWSYFGLTLLFSVPVVGFIFLIIFSIKKSNLNRRNFARSYWCSLIIVAVLLVVVLVIALLVGGLGFLSNGIASGMDSGIGSSGGAMDGLAQAMPIS